LLPVPHIGFSREPGSPLLNEQAIGLLKKVLFHHYRVALHLDDPNWQEELKRGATEAAQLDTYLELVVFFSSAADHEAAVLMTELESRNTQLFSILILQKGAPATPQALMQRLYPALKKRFGNVQVGYGTDGFFAELNRNRPAGETPHDFLSFPVNPQVHASDTRSVLENLEAQHHTLETLRTFSDKPIHVSPLTFYARHASGDARQQTNVAAWWYLSAMHNLSAAACLTFCDTTGLDGLLEATGREPARTFPVYNALLRLKAFNPIGVVQNAGASNNKPTLIFENTSGDRLCFHLGKL
jgi:hypothetical protein